MPEHFDLIVIGSGAGGGTLAHALAPTGKRILILERGDYLHREKQNWDATRGVDRAPLPQQRQLDRPGGRRVPAEAALLRGRQHEDVRRGAVPQARAGLRASAARRRCVRGLADHLRRPRALLHPGRAALPRARRTQGRPHRAVDVRPVPVPGDEPRAARRAAVLRPGGGRPPPLPPAPRHHDRRGRPAAQPLHPLRHLRRLPLPGGRQGRRPRGVRRARAAPSERVLAHRRLRAPPGDGRRRPPRVQGGGRS